LRFIEHDHVFVGRIFRRTAETLLKKVIDVLDAGAHIAPNISQAASSSGPAPAQILVTGQGLAKHND
jgi:hypothetical protein